MNTYNPKDHPKGKDGRWINKHHTAQPSFTLPDDHPDSPDVELTEEEWETFATYLSDPDMTCTPEIEKAFKDPLTHTTVSLHVIYSKQDEADTIFRKYREAGYEKQANTMRLLRALA